MSVSGNQSSSSRNQSNSFSFQYCISSILAHQYCTHPSHGNNRPTLQSFSGSIPKSGVMAIYSQDAKLDNSTEVIRENKKLFAFVTNQESQLIERSLLRRCELSVMSQQDILKTHQMGKPPLEIIPTPTFKNTET